MVVFFQKKGIDMVKPGCSIPNLAKNCLCSSTSAKCYPFTEIYKELHSKFPEHMVGGPSKAFTRKAMVEETHIRKSLGACNWTDWIDAGQFHPY